MLITELPYQVNKSSLVENVAGMVRAKRLEGISDIRDESDRTGLRVVVELKRDANANVVLNRLCKSTALRSTFGVIMLALVDGGPRIVNLKQALQQYVRHRKEVVTRRTRWLLEKARDRVHLLEGFRIALDNIDDVITIIRRSKTRQEARERLQKRFKLSERQSQAIVEMQLGALVGMERQKVEEEHVQLLQDIARYEDILASERLVLGIIKEELAELKKKYGDERRTRIEAQGAEELSAEDLIAEEDMAISVTRDGYIKRMPLDTYRLQRRGGRGITGMQTREADAVRRLLVADTHDSLLFFTDRGRVFQLRAHEIPDTSRQARGIPLINLIDIDQGELVTALVAARTMDRDFMVLATKHGEVKKTALSEFESVRRNGLISMDLESGDELVVARLAAEGEDVVPVTSDGHAVRFAVDALRSASRTSGGVRGVRPELARGDNRESCRQKAASCRRRRTASLKRPCPGALRDYR